MKLIIAIVHDRVKQKVREALVNEGITYTQLGSAGGFLRQGNATLLIAVQDDWVPSVLGILRDKCKSTVSFVTVGPDAASQLGALGAALGNVVTESAGGAVAFVLNIEEMHRI